VGTALKYLQILSAASKDETVRVGNRPSDAISEVFKAFLEDIFELFEAVVVLCDVCGVCGLFGVSGCLASTLCTMEKQHTMA
jgi:hypothetical protein